MLFYGGILEQKAKLKRTSHSLFFLFFALVLNSCAYYSIKDQQLVFPRMNAVPPVVEYKLFLPYPQAPEKNIQYPLLVALHYSNGNPSDYLDLWKKAAGQAKHFILAPAVRWGDGFEQEKVWTALDEVLRSYPVDRHHIFLAGSSSGALLAERLMLEKPELWKGVVLINYVGDNGEFENFQKEYLPPMLFAHGEWDELYPIERVTVLAENLSRRGYDISLNQYKNMRHEHPVRISQDAFDWIFEISGRKRRN